MHAVPGISDTSRGWIIGLVIIALVLAVGALLWLHFHG